MSINPTNISSNTHLSTTSDYKCIKKTYRTLLTNTDKEIDTFSDLAGNENSKFLFLFFLVTNQERERLTSSKETDTLVLKVVNGNDANLFNPQISKLASLVFATLDLSIENDIKILVPQQIFDASKTKLFTNVYATEHNAFNDILRTTPSGRVINHDVCAEIHFDGIPVKISPMDSIEQGYVNRMFETWKKHAAPSPAMPLAEASKKPAAAAAKPAAPTTSTLTPAAAAAGTTKMRVLAAKPVDSTVQPKLSFFARLFN